MDRVVHFCARLLAVRSRRHRLPSRARRLIPGMDRLPVLANLVMRQGHAQD